LEAAMRESTKVKHVLESKDYTVLRVKYAHRERCKEISSAK
jgi:hypothetical protein